MKAGFRCLTTMSTDCDKADFPSQLSCEMRVGVGVCGKEAWDKDVVFPVLPKKRKNGCAAACAKREASRAIGRGKANSPPILSHEIRVTVSMCGNAVDLRRAGFKAMPFVGHAKFVILSGDDDIRQTN